jgi:hypothetical protein
MDSNEIALLELLAIKPLSYFPPQPYMIARRLARRGLVAFKDGHWYATAEGARAANCPANAFTHNAQ